MRCARTDDSRLFQYDRMTNGSTALQSAITRYLRGIRGSRKQPVTEQQIVQWFRNTNPDMVRINLQAMVMSQRVTRRGKLYNHPGDFGLAHYYAGGDLLERTHYPSEEEARQEIATMLRLKTLAEGEILVLSRLTTELDRIAA